MALWVLESPTTRVRALSGLHPGRTEGQDLQSLRLAEPSEESAALRANDQRLQQFVGMPEALRTAVSQRLPSACLNSQAEENKSVIRQACRKTGLITGVRR